MADVGFGIDWSTLADITAVLTAPAILAAVIISAYQIVTQLSASQRQSSFDIYIQFTERFSDLLDLRSSIRSRYADLDVSLDESCVVQFYNKYWHIQVNEWEMFRAGLLPSEIFASWLCYTHDSIQGDFSMPFYRSGIGMVMTAQDAFQQIGIGQMMRSHPECREFFLALAAIPFPAMRNRPADGSLDLLLSQRRSHIMGLLQQFGRKYRHAKPWQLS